MSIKEDPDARPRNGDASDDAGMADGRPTYKSWKKKYRKMRIAFDQRMQEGEDIFKQEEKAKAMVKRIATENEYVSARALASSSGGEQH